MHMHIHIHIHPHEIPLSRSSMLPLISHFNCMLHPHHASNTTKRNRNKCLNARFPRSTASFSSFSPLSRTIAHSGYSTTYMLSSPFHLSYSRARDILSRENLHHAIAASTNDPAPIVAPYHRAHSLAAHQAMAGDLLRAAALLQTPETQAGVVARRHEFAAVR